MWIHDVAPERLAELFHHYLHALLPDLEGKAAAPKRGDWTAVPAKEKSRLVAAARLALLELESGTSEQGESRRYFARPGEAEWGC